MYLTEDITLVEPVRSNDCVGISISSIVWLRMRGHILVTRKLFCAGNDAMAFCKPQSSYNLRRGRVMSRWDCGGDVRKASPSAIAALV